MLIVVVGEDNEMLAHIQKKKIFNTFPFTKGEKYHFVFAR